MQIKKFLIVFLSCVFLPSNALILNNASIDLAQGATNLTLTFNDRVEYSLKNNSGNKILTLNFKRLKSRANFNALKFKNSLIESVKLSNNYNGTMITLFLKQAVFFQHSSYNENKNTNLIISLVAKKELASKVINIQPKQKKISVQASANDLRNIRILIDAGHGGNDVGSIGKNGTTEKSVTLAVAKLLEKHIRKEPGLRALMTRTNDQYIHKRVRLVSAREKDSDIFVSIHADGFYDASCHGASVYALSQKTATSESARWLAAKENYSVLGGEIDLETKGDMLRSVLVDLSQTATIKASLKMGKCIINELQHVTHVRGGRVEQGPFSVLRSPDIPTILVELGFLSNESEEKKLRQVKYQKKLAKAIFRGIATFIKNNPIRNTYLAKHTLHTVKRNDNLAKIAKQYSSTVHDIKAMNKLKSNSLKIGKKLYIPQII